MWLPCCAATECCLVFIAESPSPGHCNTFLDADIMDSSAHHPGRKVRALESLSGDTMSKLADVRCEWGGRCWEWFGAENGAKSEDRSSLKETSALW